MKLILAVFVLIASLALVTAAVPSNFLSIDDLRDDENGVGSSSGTPLVDAEQVNLSQGASNYFSTRDLSISWNTASSGGNIRTYVQGGAWITNSGSFSGGRSSLQYDGNDAGASPAASGVTPLASSVNLAALGYALYLEGSSDLSNTNLTIDIYSGATANFKSTFTIPSLPVRSGTNEGPTADVFPITVLFSQFTGNADRTQVTAIVYSTAGENDQDVVIKNIGILTTSVSGRVYTDCSCNNQFDSSTDTGIEDATVTATPSNSCGDPNAIITIQTASDGTYTFTGLQACAYAINVAQNTGSICSGSGGFQKSVTLTTSVTSVTGVNFPFQASGSFTSVPATTTVGCKAAAPVQTATFSKTGSCGSSQVTGTTVKTAPTCNAQGSYTYTYSSGGQTATSTVLIDNDVQVPVLTIPTDKTFTCAQTSGTPSSNNPNAVPTSQSGQASSTDDCSGSSTSFLDQYQNTCTEASCTSTVTISRTFKAKDDCGRESATQTQTITVTNCGGNSFTCPLIDYSCDTQKTGSIATTDQTSILLTSSSVSSTPSSGSPSSSPVSSASSASPISSGNTPASPFSTLTTFDRFSSFTSDASGACDCGCDGNNNNAAGSSSSGAETLVASFTVLFAVLLALF